jgi:hypothetical protein
MNTERANERIASKPKKSTPSSLGNIWLCMICPSVCVITVDIVVVVVVKNVMNDVVVDVTAPNVVV